MRVLLVLFVPLPEIHYAAMDLIALLRNKSKNCTCSICSVNSLKEFEIHIFSYFLIKIFGFIVFILEVSRFFKYCCYSEKCHKHDEESPATSRFFAAKNAAQNDSIVLKIMFSSDF
jgi:hypothetical protein